MIALNAYILYVVWTFPSIESTTVHSLSGVSNKSVGVKCHRLLEISNDHMVAAVPLLLSSLFQRGQGFK